MNYIYIYIYIIIIIIIIILGQLHNYHIIIQ